MPQVVDRPSQWWQGETAHDLLWTVGIMVAAGIATYLFFAFGPAGSVS
ncbi:MAG: hypothetical protein OQJ99_05345 [Rhodospirillales bacterium]|nr:hypothetical protein [Rhodospirillales bacterium]MCW8862521.1 hypothetical protein [Rhodospirillales bacterium]MCW9001781.1 hypothetical protein [Rhodospirillales bacterium]MCW9040702.1 hypothetical protein [Rhodospirillales bacterium]